jgi:hypothetical protein
LPAEQQEDPRPGDRVYIWINKTGGGRGLTATADVADATPSPTELRTQVAGVRLYNPIGVLNDDHLPGPPDSVIEDIYKSRLVTLRFLSVEDANVLDEAVREISSGQTPVSASAVRVAPPPLAIDLAALAVGTRVRMSLIEQRANQGPFRDAVMARDRGKCVVTGCRVSELLEAAHLIPYASGHPDRDNPSNGVLLRADIHLLFDRDLMAINPQTLKIWVSSRLQSSAYRRLDGKEVRPAAGLAYLRYHYETATVAKPR